MNKRYILLFLALCWISQAFGNEAVSEFNGKVDSSYGNLNSSDGWISEGSVSFPIADTLGFQFDALYADIEEVDVSGFGGHLFWRDHKIGLLGISLGGIFDEGIDSYELSIEGEYYFSWITLGAKTGHASIEYEDYVPFIETEKDVAFGLLYFTAYPIDDLSVTVGLESRFDNDSIRLDAEYELPIDGLSLFSRSMIAENDYDHVLFGLRYYFGGNKSLKQRHRHDDPRNVVQDVLFGVGTYGAEYNKRGNEFIRKIRANGGSGSIDNFGTFSSYGRIELADYDDYNTQDSFIFRPQVLPHETP